MESHSSGNKERNDSNDEVLFLAMKDEDNFRCEEHNSNPYAIKESRSWTIYYGFSVHDQRQKGICPSKKL